MPFLSRRRPHLSSLQTNQIEVQGATFLCFPEDGSWFQGTINSEGDDESSYTLYGERVSPDPSVEEDQDLQKSSSLITEYRVTLTDHFTGLSYHLPRMGVKTPEHNENIFICKDKEADVKFRVDNIFKGQKADMVIQKSVGSSALVGRKCQVYSGPIDIVFNEVIEAGQRWCL